MRKERRERSVSLYRKYAKYNFVLAEIQHNFIDQCISFFQLSSLESAVPSALVCAWLWLSWGLKLCFCYWRVTSDWILNMLKIVRCFSVTSLKKTVFTPACQRSWNGDPSYHLLLRRYMPLTALCQRWAHSRHNENWQCDVTDPEWAGHIANTVLQHVDESQTVLHECYPGG